MVYNEVTAVATAVLGYDLLTGHRMARDPNARVIKGVALVGSAAAGDAVVELVVDGKSLGKFENTATGTAVDIKRDLKAMDEFVRSNALVQLVVRDAPGTNDVRAMIEFGAPARRRSFKRSYRKRSYGSGGSGQRSGFLS